MDRLLNTLGWQIVAHFAAPQWRDVAKDLQVRIAQLLAALPRAYMR